MKEWYRTELKDILPQIIDRWCELVGTDIPTFEIMTIPQRWGSCNKGKKHIVFNLEPAKNSCQASPKSGLKNSSAKLFPKVTLLMAMYGATIGKLGILNVNAATNKACCAIFCNLIDVKFVFYYLLLNRTSIIEKCYGAGQPNISQSIVNYIDLFLPSALSEQTAIAEILSNVDSEIAELEAKRAKYKQVKQGMMQQLLTGKIRLLVSKLGLPIAMRQLMERTNQRHMLCLKVV